MAPTADTSIRCSACTQDFPSFTDLAVHIRAKRGTDAQHPLPTQIGPTNPALADR